MNQLNNVVYVMEMEDIIIMVQKIYVLILQVVQTMKHMDMDINKLIVLNV